ncbi:MAG: hypothetical protein HAW62_04900 [Endozoicomonadaceae bacterium]|nr:hypothetical protein [Endozoicomonadaceae bacterium]
MKKKDTNINTTSFANLTLQETIAASKYLVKQTNKNIEQFALFQKATNLKPNAASEILQKIPKDNKKLIEIKDFLIAENAYLPEEPDVHEARILSKKEKMSKLLRHKNMI